MKDENTYMIELEDGNGNKKKYEVLDTIIKDEEDYVVLLPEGSESEVVIFKILSVDDETNEVEYIEVEDEEIADDVFNEFLKRMDLEGDI